MSIGVKVKKIEEEKGNELYRSIKNKPRNETSFVTPEFAHTIPLERQITTSLVLHVLGLCKMPFELYNGSKYPS